MKLQLKTIDTKGLKRQLVEMTLLAMQDEENKAEREKHRVCYQELCRIIDAIDLGVVKEVEF